MYNTGEGQISAPTDGANMMETIWYNIRKEYDQAPKRIELADDLYGQLKAWIREMEEMGMIGKIKEGDPMPTLRTPMLYDRLDGTEFVGYYKDADVLHNPTLPAGHFRYYVPPYIPFFARQATLV